jgi:CARDB
MASHSRVLFTGIVVVVAALSGPAAAVSQRQEPVVAEALPDFGTNPCAVGVQIGLDLKITALSAPSRAAIGSAIVVNDTTRDSGGCGADASVTAFYLSTNSTLDESDIRLAPARAIGPLTAGASSAGTSNVIIPDVAPGTWFLIANADDGEIVNEIAESNNRRLVSIHIYSRP